MEFLQSVINSISEFMTGGVFATVVIVLEMVMRMVKTDKPMSIIYIVSGFLKKSSELLSLIASLLDKVLPQRVK